MKVGVVSDVHNNLEALTYAMEALRGCEVILNLGDLVSQYRVVPDTLRMAREHELLSILGNHEKSILLPQSSRLRDSLASHDRELLEALPDQRRLEFDGRRVFVVHGSPWDDATDVNCRYIYERSREVGDLEAAAEADVLLMGHTHVAWAQRLGGLSIINPGSCGEARDREGRLSYAELDFAASVATVWQVCHGMAPAVICTAPL